jgi:hypothetical protein
MLGAIKRDKADEERKALGELETISREIADLETKRANPDPSYRVRPEILVLEARALLTERESDLPGAEKLSGGRP